MNRGEMSYAKVRDVLYYALRDAGEGRTTSENLSRKLTAALRAAGVAAEEPGPVTDAQRRSVFTDFLTYRLIPAEVREYLEGYLEAMDDE